MKSTFIRLINNNNEEFANGLSVIIFFLIFLAEISISRFLVSVDSFCSELSAILALELISLINCSMFSLF